MSIQRYEKDGPEAIPNEHGGWVLFRDHEELVGRLKELLEGYRRLRQHQYCDLGKTLSNEDYDYRCDLCRYTDKELKELGNE